jgi:hypothetical protein
VVKQQNKPMSTIQTDQQKRTAEEMPSTTPTRPPLPPFTRETAIQKVRLAEDGWNSRDPEKVALAYTVDSRWRNRAEFPNGRQEIIQFLRRKWASGKPLKPIPYKALDLERPWQSFDTAHELTTAGIQKFVADYRSTLRRSA